MAPRVVISDDSSSSSSDDMPTTTTARRDDLEGEASSESGQGDSDEDAINEMIDLEAHESGTSSPRQNDDEEDSDESETELRDMYYTGRKAWHAPHLSDFPQFMKLPYELRMHIWKSLCPDLYGETRVMHLEVIHSARPDIGWYPTDGMYLADETEDLRTVLAVHQESRRFALTKFPDTFNLNYTNDHVVPFNKENDIVYLYQGPIRDETEMPEPAPTNFCAQIRNLALRPSYIVGWDGHVKFDLNTVLQFPNLKTIYACQLLPFADNQRTWIQSEHCDWYTMVTWEDGDLYDARTILYAFHKAVECNAEGACSPLTKSRLHGFLGPEDDILARSPDPEPVQSFEHARERLQSIRKYSLLVFETGFSHPDEKGVIRSKNTPSGLEIVGEEVDNESESRSGSNDEENEYESEGIDDDPIPEPETEDEEEGTGIEDDTLAMELLSHSPAAGGFSPLQVVDSDTLESNSDSSAPASPSKRTRARRVILDDSDEEDDGEEAELEPAARGRKRQRVVSDEDEDDEDDADIIRAAKRNRRALVVEDDSDVEVTGARPRGNHYAPIVLESEEEGDEGSASRSDPETSEEDEEDEDDQPAKPLTLAERLRMHREANPIPAGSDDSEDADGTDDSHGAYNEDSEDEDEGGALVADMAEDGSDDGFIEEDDDRYYR